MTDIIMSVSKMITIPLATVFEFDPSYPVI